MKLLLETIKSKLSEFPKFSAVLNEGVFDDEIIIKIGYTEKFKINFMLFGGYSISFKVYENIEINTPKRNETQIWDIIERLILGEKEQIKMKIDKRLEEYSKLKSKEDIQELYDDQEGSNMHEDNTLLLAIHYGTEEDLKEIKKINLINELAGYALEDYSDIHEKLYAKLQTI